VERARLQQPTFALAEENATAVTAICRRLDGMPLAIELAAARLDTLPVQAIAARLDDRFKLLSRGNRTALPHQRTLRATLDWSYALLTGAERTLLRRLSVFAGGCTLEAAEAVCAGGDTLTTAAPGHGEDAENRERSGLAIATLGQDNVLDALAGLVGKSLVRRDHGRDTARYGMLETIRQYGREQLDAAGELATLQDRHLAWCLALAEIAEPNLWGAAQGVWLAKLEAEHDNLRAALTWSLAAHPESRAVEGTAIAGLLWRFWWLHGHFSEGRAWLEGLLANGKDIPAGVRALALNGAGNLAQEQSDYARARALHEEALAIRTALGDRQGISASLGNLGLIAYYQGDFPRARALHEESLALRRMLGDTRGIAASLSNLARVSLDLGEYARASALLEEGLALYRRLGDTRGIGGVLNDLGNVADYQGDYDRAMALYQETLDLHRGLGHLWGVAITLGNMGIVAHKQGDYSRARTLHLESLAEFRALGDRRGIGTCLTWLALAAGAEGHAAYGARLAGAAEALRAAIDSPLVPQDLATHELVVATMREALGEAGFSAAWAAGRALTMDVAIAEATAAIS
jgi:non-specific serine/threonine protein kinase